ncbi:c-type cytochrome [Pseudoprimorskyibacter insulae]|uniref:Cytochrome c n=1 Tax=Pseudoprimorskyibacter insulae TaxID=1695997 RepID=A0A2R8AX39_9RHOB|nr:cytochrome c [Pseudoprimorskyibacter insulae]SPF80424.1 Cytochrome c' [Pseudoprimorskyibacter insulae]
MYKTIALVAGLALLATPAISQNINGAVKARQGQFNVLAINLGVLGGMAKGEIEYSAEAAGAAADSLVGVAMINQAPLWPAASDEMAIDGTRAKADIWDNWDDFQSKWDALGTAAAAMKVAAAEGPDAIGPALGALGGACKACHEAYRAPAN